MLNLQEAEDQGTLVPPCQSSLTSTPYSAMRPIQHVDHVLLALGNVNSPLQKAPPERATEKHAKNLLSLRNGLRISQRGQQPPLCPLSPH